MQLLLGAVLAGNPLVPNSGMADANIKFMNGTFLVFATHDFAPTNAGFKMRDWQIWASDDAVTWRLGATLNPTDVVTWSTAEERNECWATDAAFVNGSYFFYLSVGPTNVAVVTAPSVAGPWHDPLGRPLLTAEMVGTPARDPCVFEDDDGSFYIIAGVFNYRVARLAPDMSSLAEPMRNVTINGAWGCCRWPTTTGASTADKPFLHKRGKTYYLSWGCFYAVAASVYGPFEMVGSVLDTRLIAPAFRTNTTENKDVWFLGHDYADRHGSFLHHENQWVFVSNDRSHSAELGPGGANKSMFYRDTVGCYIHFRPNVTLGHDVMSPCTIDAAGIGQYDGGAVIEVENFFGASDRFGTIVSDNKSQGLVLSGDFAVAARAGAVLHYPHVSIAAIPTAVVVRLQRVARLAATLEFWACSSSSSSSAGQLLGRAHLAGVLAAAPGLEEVVCSLDFAEVDGAIMNQLHTHRELHLQVTVVGWGNEPGALLVLDTVQLVGQ
jgi:hypothetical protein